MIRILLSDDNPAFRQSSREQGAALGVEVVPFDDWESAQSELDENFELYQAVIIDGKGKLRDSSKAEDSKHLVEAIGWFREQNAKGRFIPVVVYTGFHPEIEAITTLNSQVKGVFDKSTTKFENVLDFLREEIKKLPVEKMRSKFPSVYEFSKRFFSIENKQIILAICDGLNSTSQDFIWKKNILDGLRRLNEALADSIPLHYYSAPFELRDFLAKINRENPPRNGRKEANMGNRTVRIIEFFEIDYKAKTGQLVPGPISSAVKNIYYTGATYASHTSENETDYYPSTEMVLGLVYSHFGCYHWFNQIIKD